MRYLLVVSALAIGCGQATAANPRPHPKSFWREIAQAGGAVPPGESAPALALELARHLGDPDPEWRDDFGYTITATWVQKGILGPEQLRPLLPIWLQGLKAKGPSQIYRRSFAALHLALAAALDQKSPFLDETTFRACLEGGLELLQHEKDDRGFDAAHGWVHIAAHASDLLACLARSPRLQAMDQPRILDALESRLMRGKTQYAFGEETRMAALAAALAQREDGDLPNLLATVHRLAALPAGFEGVRPLPGPYALKHNATAFLKSLHFTLSREGLRSPRAKTAAQAILEALSKD